MHSEEPRADGHRDSLRVLLLTPHGRDAEIASRILSDAEMEVSICESVAELTEHIESGAGAVILAVEALNRTSLEDFTAALESQPSWSELPLIVLAAPGSGGSLGSPGPLDSRAHVTVLDRPLRTKTLISATRSALRARQRQYQLRDVMEALEGRIHERDRFLAILGHELRNPLGAILLASQTTDDEDGRLDTEHAQIIERQARHLTHLVDDLLDLSRITAGKIVLQKESVNLGYAVEQCLRVILESPRYQGADVDVRTRLQNIYVDADPVRLEQIISNLLTNALKYTPAGGWVEVMVERTDGHGLLRVKDSGVGIAPDRLVSIFGLFAQAENSIGRTQGGMGIGLSLVRNLVELHHGTVSATSDGVGRGSEFVVTLPLAKETADRNPKHEERSHPSKEKALYSIVIIEDNADVRALLQVRLRKLGHTVESAADGERGIEQIVKLRPDIAIVDIGLPGMDGYAVARRVREECGDGTFLAALSGFGQPEDKKKALESGFDEHITKPIDGRALEELLNRLALTRVRPEADSVRPPAPPVQA